MAKKKNDKNRKLFLKVGIICLTLFIISYVIYHIVQRTNNELVTEFAVKETVYSTIETEAFIIRDEQFIKNSATGTTVSFVNNGERVGATDIVSMVFDSSADALTYMKVTELKKEIAHYETLAGQANYQILNTDSINDKIDRELIAYLNSVDNRDFSDAIANAETFRDSVIGKQIATGTSPDFSEKLNSLQAELNELEEEKYSYTEIKADSAGYFIEGSDGYENLIDYEKIDEIDINTIEDALKSKPAKKDSTVVGRTVASFNWYIACVVDSDASVSITFDKKIYLNLPEAGVEKLPVSVYKIGPRTEDGTFVIFSCDEMNENLADLRIEKIQIITDEYTGYKVSNSAIRTVDGQKGVYIVRGNLMGFRKINIVYSGDEYSIVDNPENSSDYIKLYDKVVREGVDLYDDKLV